MAPRDVIWILGASTSETYSEIEKNIIEKIEKNTIQNTKIVICASLKTYQQAIKSKQVYQLPTNLRSHYGPEPKKMGSIEVDDTESFIAAQEDTSQALADTLNLAQVKNIPVYFAIVDRANRPTYLVQDKGGGISASAPKDKQGILLLPNADVGLSNEILNQLLVPSYDDEKLDVKLEMRKACRHGATYLADVLTVGCALVGEDAWTPYRMTSPAKILSDGSFLKKGFVDKIDDGVPYLDANFEQSDDGLFKSFNQDAVPQMTQALRDIMGKRRPCFGKSLVIHDALLNDIDDLPAIRLIQEISEKTDLFVNYHPIALAATVTDL
jgi:hypothetical protein